MKNQFIFAIIFISLWYSCVYKTEYTSVPHSKIQYKLLAFDSENARKPQKGDFIYLSLYSNNQKPLVTHKIWVFEQKKNKWINPLLKKVQQGDSIEFKIPRQQLPDSLKYSQSDSVLNFFMKIHKIQSPYEFQKELEYQQWLKDRELSEQVDLLNYLKANNIDYRYFTEGIYLIPLKKGNGKKAQKGNTVYLHYKGYFLDGKEFDSTYKDGEPLEYRIGDPDQVIKGFEIAVAHLSEHAKAKIIIPSHLAFGAKGSSTGVIKPYTTLIYELE
ncbi:MAG: FKBP-type peptidyl-prolyl cis-trans isomerase, partial [Bacteroidetes bacterium]